MSPESFAERVFRLEAQMSDLQELPARVHDLTLRVSQLRSEMGVEFSAVRGAIDDTRGDMRALREEFLGRLDTAIYDVLGQLDAVSDRNRGEMRALREEFLSRLDTAIYDVLGRLDAAEDDSRREARVLHEEVLSRIALIGEGSTKPSRKKARRPKR